MFNSEQLQEKWQPVLNHPDLPEINDAYKRAVTAVILENQERELKESRQMLAEADMTTGSDVANWDPVLISLVRRAMPSLIAYDVCGVQPMSGPTGLIFAMKARAADGGQVTDAEALHDEADTGFSNANFVGQTGSNPGALNGGTAPSTNETTEPDIWGESTTASGSDQAGSYNVKPGDSTSAVESYAVGGSPAFSQMGFTIEKATVTARSRALHAGYTMELAQDLKAIHGLDAESELSNILSQEILQEINREVIRTIYVTAEVGAQGCAAGNGTFNLDLDSNGRWSVEKFKGLLFQIEKDCNAIGIRTRRGKGNILMCSADTASALSMAGVLDYAPAMSSNLNVDPSPSGNTFAGTINGRIKVYVDPYASAVDGASDWYVAGYRGSSAYDAGLFYCPYVPLQMVRAVSETTFQPRIAFKTRYGMAENPFAKVGSTGAINSDAQPFNDNANCYYRRAKVTNIM